MRYTERQLKIIDLVQENMPITSEKIAAKLEVSRAAIRNDLSILVMKGILEAKPKVGYYYIGNVSGEDKCKQLMSLKVKDVMSPPVVVEEKASIYDGIITMFLEDAGTLYIVAKGYLSGVVSRKDFLKIVMGGSDINRIPVGIIMTRMPNLKFVEEDELLIDAAEKIISCEIDSMPVVSRETINGEEKFKIVGRVSKTTVTRVAVEIFKE